MPKRHVTLKDIAQVAGVHFTTVGRALKTDSDIAAPTREKIASIARALGYRPDHAQTALARFRRHSLDSRPTSRLAYVVNRSPEMRYHHLTHHPQFIQGARQRAASLGFELELLFVAEDHFDSEGLHAYLQENGIEGLIIGAFEPGLSTLALPWEEYSIVKIESKHMEPAAVSVSNDQAQAVRLAFEKLLALGYKRIGLAVGRADEDSTDFRHSLGYVVAQEVQDKLERIPALFFPYNANAEDVEGLLGRWVRRHRVDAVLCNWWTMCDRLAAAGLRVPADVAGVCLCLHEEQGSLSGVVPDLRTIGAKAASVLTMQMREGSKGVPAFASNIYVQGTWHQGETAPQKN